MQESFWHRRWTKNEIGFHQSGVHKQLIEYWPALNVESGTVFVPLCGKSLDMIWLAEQGHQVLGIELSRIAIEDFFAQLQLSADVRQEGAFERWHHPPYTLLCGDFFQLETHHLASVSAVYDRAALIALPPAMRADYVQAKKQLLPAPTPMMLITLEYSQQQMDGPPFAVHEDEVRALYHDWCEIQWQSRLDVLADHERFRDKGLTELHEAVYMLRS